VAAGANWSAASALACCTPGWLVESKGKRITAFEVLVNGKKVGDPEMKTTSGMGGGASNFVFQATTLGTYQFEIVPLIDGQRGEPRLHTLEVEE